MRNVIALTTFALLTATSDGSAQTALNTTADVLPGCRAIAAAGSPLDFSQNLRTGLCWGGFAAIQRALVYTDADWEPSLSVCPPPESTLVQLITIFVGYVDRHPEVLHEHFFDIAVRSIREAFPCPDEARGSSG